MFLENVRFGGYKLKSMIGKGGVAEVWLADQLALDREVALKVLPSELVSGEGADFIDRFKREAQAIGKLDHPGILAVFDYGEADGYLYLVMPLARGGNLRSRVRRKALKPTEIGSIFDNIVSGAAHAHAHGIIHRDLKPANILLNEEGRAFIGDFGIAKTMDNSATLTQAGLILGSPSFMAPEQFMGYADVRSDIYSLGLILFFMLTGRKLYTGRMPFEIGNRHLNEPLPLPDPQVPPEYEPFLRKALAKKPDDRFQTATEMLKAFRAIKGYQPPISEFIPGVFDSNTGSMTPVPLPPQTPGAAIWHRDQVKNEPFTAAPSQETSALPAPPPPPQPRNPYPTAQEMQWHQEKGALPEQPLNTLLDVFWIQNSQKSAPPAPSTDEARWLQEKNGISSPVSSTQPVHIKEDESSTRQQTPEEVRWFQEKAGAGNLGPDEMRWLQDKNGGAAQNMPPGAPPKRDEAYERFSREKAYPPPPTQADQRTGMGTPARPDISTPAVNRPTNDQMRLQQEKAGGPVPPAGEARWLQGKVGGPFPPPAPVPASQEARWLQEKNGGPVSPSAPSSQEARWLQEKNGGAPQVPVQGAYRPAQPPLPPQPPAIPPGYRTPPPIAQAGPGNLPNPPKPKGKTPVWLFALIGVLVVAIVGVGVAIFLTNGSKPNPTATVQASGATPSAATGPTKAARTTVASATTSAVTASPTTAPATTQPPTPAAIALTGHAGPVNSVAWSSSGALFLTASDDKTLKIWDAASNKAVKTLDDKAKPINDRVLSAVFSPDGNFVVAGIADKTTRVFSVKDGVSLATLEGTAPTPAAISPDQALVPYITARTIRTLDLKKNGPGPEYPYFDSKINGLAPTALAYSPDSSTLAVGLNNGRIIFYNAASGQPLMTYEPDLTAKDGVRFLAWFGNGNRLAVAGEKSFATLSIDLKNNLASPVLAAQPLANPASGLAVSSDSKRLAVSSQKGELLIWSLENNQQLGRFNTGSNPVVGLHWTQDGQQVTAATGGSSPALTNYSLQAAARSANITLTARNGTNVSGTSTLTELPGSSVRVVLNVTGLTPGEHKVHIHAGTCANQGDIKFDLENLRPSADGSASSTTVIKADFSALVTGSFYINVHNDPGTDTYIASCGEIHV